MLEERLVSEFKQALCICWAGGSIGGERMHYHLLREEVVKVSWLSLLCNCIHIRKMLAKAVLVRTCMHAAMEWLK